MEYIRIPVGKATWHIRVEGEGVIPLLGMHGFSQDASYFHSLSDGLRGCYQLWSIDLPGHGKTDWPAGQPCTPDALAVLAREILARSGSAQLSIAGFSMGARYAEGMVTGVPDLVRSLHLISPEGLRPNFGLGFATGNPLGRYLLRRMIHKPGFLLAPTRLIVRTGLVNKKLTNFLLFHLNRPEMRKLVRDSWSAMRGLPRADRRFADLVRERKIDTHVWIGRKDVLVRIADGKDFAARASAGLHLLDRGHSLIDFDFAAKMLEVER